MEEGGVAQALPLEQPPLGPPSAPRQVPDVPSSALWPQQQQEQLPPPARVHGGEGDLRAAPLEGQVLALPQSLTLAGSVRHQHDSGGGARAVGEQRGASRPRRAGAVHI